MKIFPISDVHTEFENYLEELPEADVCVLAGDWCVAARLHQSKYRKRVTNFIQRLSDAYHAVIVIAGNHEYYHGYYETTDNIIREFLRPWANVAYLQRNTIIIAGVCFIGCTLWTDFANDNPMAKLYADYGMTDYRVIKKGEATITPDDILAVHREDLAYIDHSLWLARYNTRVVITHHAPSYRSCHPEFAGSYLNPAFMSELPEKFFEKPTLWIHGHIHWNHDYDHYGCRVVLNARGYPFEHTCFDPKFVIEVPSLDIPGKQLADTER